jgi:hypothetical protein
MFRNRLFHLLPATLLLAGVVGCAGQNSPELASVTGKVTMNGQPLQDAIVVFEPQSGRPSTGRTEADGTFFLYYSESLKGAVPGQHTVRISKMEAEAGAELIAAKYHTGSTMSETVSKDGENNFQFDLK